MIKMVKKRIILCLFGVVPRSIKYTYPQIKDKIIDSIKRDHDLKVYVFNLNVSDIKVDGEKMNQKDCKIIDSDYFEETFQTEADKELDEFCRNGKCVIQSINYESERTKNSLRVMYVEYQISKFLQKHKEEFDYAIIWSADYYPITELNIHNDTESVFTSDQADFLEGYTDGFYMGNIENVIKIQQRYEILNKILPHKGNHETIFKEGFVRNNISRKVHSINFFKIRADKKIKSFGGKHEKLKKSLEILPIPKIRSL